MVKIVGHRGAAGYAPENTLLSFKKAIDVGCNRTELDVRLSSNLEVVVIHDEDVSRVTTGTGLVGDLSLAEIKKLNCCEDQKIPTLQEVIELCKNKIELQIELKVEGTPRKVNEILLKNKLVDDVLITSFDANLAQEMKNINPNVKVGLLFKEVSETVWDLVDTIPLDVLGFKGKIMNKEIVHEVHKRRKILYAYHVNEKNLGKKLIEMGVDEIGTDFPHLFINS